MEAADDNTIQWLIMLLFAGFILRSHVFGYLLGVKKISVHELTERMSAKPPLVLVDVRTVPEFEAGHAPGALHVPLSELRRRAEEVKGMCRNSEVAVVCRTGNRSLSGSVILRRAGIETVYNVVGGMIHWEGQGYPVRK